MNKEVEQMQSGTFRMCMRHCSPLICFLERRIAFCMHPQTEIHEC
jgi:hypothetical protein